MVPVGRRLIEVGRALGTVRRSAIRRARLSSYFRTGRRPWSVGYQEYRGAYLGRVLADPALLETFRDGRSLPDEYGYRLDARVVEIPWLISRLGDRSGQFLDAGSSLNREAVLRASCFIQRRVTILTLAPEAACFWYLGVSYVFGDLRETPFQDAYFDEIACISTIEHVGMDNTLYTRRMDIEPRGVGVREFLRAVSEFRRILKPGGVLFLTLPFGRYENHGWFHQFDARLLDVLCQAFAPREVSETIYGYTPAGWQLSDRAACADAEFFDVWAAGYKDPTSVVSYPADFAAGERAVACVELRG